jgi:hypothetical protein
VKNSNNLTSIVTSLCLLAVFGLACGGSATDSSSTTDSNINTDEDGVRTGDSRLSAGLIAGSYTVSGTNVDGAGNYTGELTVTPREEVLQFSWTSAAKTYEGVGVERGNTVAVAFTEGVDGKGCEVVLYTINKTGVLHGRAGYWGVNTAEDETATRVSGTDLEGKYNVSGTNSGGGDYKGTLDVKKDGDGYAFEWNTGSVVKGFGIRQGNTASIGIGGPQCGFVSYEVKPDGTLEGKWGGQGTKSFGTEVAKKK